MGINKDRKIRSLEIKLSMMAESIQCLKKKLDNGNILDEERITLRDLEADYMRTARSLNRINRT